MKTRFFPMLYVQFFSLLDRCQPGPMKLVLLVIIGWLVTQKRNDPMDFSDFLDEVRGTIKVDKSQSQIFEKKYWFGDIRKKVSKLALLVGWLVGW